MEATLSFARAEEADIASVAALYNSNPAFLEAHLGVTVISEAFIRAELVEMRKAGFVSLLIFNGDGELLGLCDYRPGEEAYLSLLMLAGACKGRGLGRDVYRRLEALFLSQGALRVRIDVAIAYNESPLGFWEKQGFTAREPILLTWQSKHIPALTMEKRLAAAGR